MRSNTCHRRRFLQSALAMGCALEGMPARAETGHVLFGFAPGSGVSPIILSLLNEMKGHYLPDLGTQLHYMPGNAGANAIEAMIQADADGGTVLVSPSGVFTLLPLMHKLPTVDPVNDVVPVIALGEFTFVFAVGRLVPSDVNTLTDYIHWAQDNPMQANYGIAAIGGVPHFMGTALAQATDTPLRPVTYKGDAPLLQDIVNGGVSGGFLVSSTGLDAFRNGQLRRLAVTSETRWPALPQVPTLREQGVSDMGFRFSYGLFVSARTPQPQVKALEAAAAQALRTASVRTALDATLFRAPPADAPAYADTLAQDRTMWRGLVAKYRFTV